MAIRTSETHPLKVGWLPVPAPGKVGLTFAPGKWQPHAFTGEWARDLASDIERLSSVFEVRNLVCLLEDHEIVELRIAEIATICATQGVGFHRLPIPDGGLPPETSALSRLVSEILQWTAAGQNVVVHCKGGLGRAGTVGGCVLRGAGLDARQALAALQVARGPNCPETEA